MPQDLPNILFNGKALDTHISDPIWYALPINCRHAISCEWWANSSSPRTPIWIKAMSASWSWCEYGDMKFICHLSYTGSQEVHDIGVILQAEHCDNVIGVQRYAEQRSELLLTLGICCRASRLQCLQYRGAFQEYELKQSFHFPRRKEEDLVNSATCNHMSKYSSNYGRTQSSKKSWIFR